MRFTATEIAAITGGSLIGPDVECNGASIDSRSIGEGELFVPIVADRDGHGFIGAAQAAGAAASLTSQAGVATGGTTIVVGDTGDALAALGRAARARHDGPVIAITGSVAKTSVKDLTAAAIAVSRRTHASQRSFNNELGVPLTLVNAPEDAEVLVVEMGARGPGHIAYLCEIAAPTIGIVTWVGAVHTSEFGSLEAVAAAKGELVEALPSTGTAILNVDCDLVAAMADRTDATVVTYGEAGNGAMVVAEQVRVDDQLRPRFDALIGGLRQPIALEVRGVHQVSNALAALTAADAVGVALGDSAAALTHAAISPWRMQLERSKSRTWILNDAYNANAISTAAALRSLAALPADRRIAVLGVMAELGDRHDADHLAMAELCASLGVELIAYNERAYGVESLVSHDAVIDRLDELGADGDHVAVLVKGSRVAGLEALAERLLAR